MVLTEGKITELRKEFNIENKFSVRMFTRNVWNEAQKERDKMWSEKFDKYACIKNDKWYLDWKKSLDLQ